MATTRLALENVSLIFRVYGVGGRSLKTKLISFGTGGRLARDAANHFVVHALNNLSMELNEGDRLGIVGSNGSGKSTLLRTMAGIYRPHTGRVTACGRVAAIIDSGIGLESHATGYENIRSRAVLMGVARRDWPSFMERVAELSELGDYLAMPVHTYSSGMLMRLNFSLSVSIDPDILILDEWLSVADQSFRNKAEEHMKRLVDKSRILVLASHNLELLERLCNRGLFLKGGSKMFEGLIADTIAAYSEGK
ncbi:MAG: ABC transporter ATP-binding protein [Chthoniobacterales bacterium]|nr:ABC transporter ATP-binding protein [Chthoniobacterales bacterium]